MGGEFNEAYAKYAKAEEDKKRQAERQAEEEKFQKETRQEASDLMAASMDPRQAERIKEEREFIEETHKEGMDLLKKLGEQKDFDKAA